jgi:cytochrome P450
VSPVGSASLLENARFNALVIVPNALQGIFRRRRAAVLAATRANVDGQAVGLLSGMYRNHGGGPVWVRVMRDRALLLLTPADVHRALENSPEPFASDPKPKRDGMVTFQPDALTISRGETWRNRRAFTEAVLADDGVPEELADRFAAVAAEEAGALAEAAASNGSELGWEPWNLAFHRITRRVVLGDGAAGDDELSAALGEMMGEANGMPEKTSPEYRRFVTRLGEYVSAAEDGSLVSRFHGAPADAETNPVGQLPHWLFATGDTLAINALRALVLIVAHPGARERAIEDDRYLGACLQEAMRLYPTTTMLSRETTAETEWNGAAVPAGTQVLIPNTFLHRDRDRFEYADRFAPERWTDGDAGEQWSFNHFSRGPQGCPGAALAILLGKSALATLLRRHELELASPSIDPAKPLPHMIDFFGIRIGVDRPPTA